MAKRIVQMHDKYKSTTNIYPKVTMGSLSPQVKAYIEGQGGEFPSLEITAEQQQSEGIYLLTDEQIATMEDATFMYIKVPTLTKSILFFRGVDQMFDGVYLVGVTVVSNSNYSNLFIRYGLSVNKSNNLASLRDGSLGRYEITSITASDGVISSVSIKDYLTKNTSVLTVGGGGKQLYQHKLFSKDDVNGKVFYLTFILNEEIASYNDFKTWLTTKGYTDSSNPYYLTSGTYNGYSSFAICNSSGTIYVGYCGNGSPTIAWTSLQDSSPSFIVEP